ncbi:MAG: type II secretion system protein [Acidimicrobiia bacterium]
MLNTLHKRLNREEDGFTLIELMVVVLIIAILIAIAVPTFLGAQDRARDRAAQSDLRNAMTAAKTIATDDAGLFTSISAANLTAAEGALNYGAADGTDPTNTTVVGWDVDLTTTPQRLQMVRLSASGKAYGIRILSDGKTYFCSNKGASDAASIAAVADTADTCDGTKW